MVFALRPPASIRGNTVVSHFVCVFCYLSGDCRLNGRRMTATMHILFICCEFVDTIHVDFVAGNIADKNKLLIIIIRAIVCTIRNDNE